MKRKNVLLLALLSLVLVACSGQKASQGQVSSPSASSSSQPVSEKIITERLRYQEDLDGQTKVMTETVTYQGDKFLALDLLLEEPLEPETKEILSSQNLSEIKGDIIKSLESDSSLRQLQAITGVQTELDIRDDYTFVARVKIDMTKVDLDQLASIEGLTGNFTDFKVLKPKDYIASLIDQGAERID